MNRPINELIKKYKLKDHFARVEPNTTVFEALCTLEKNNSGAALVMDGHNIVGIFTERDLARAIINKGIAVMDSVHTLMTSRVYYVDPNFTLEECLQIMSKAHFRHLPVLEDGIPIALISMRQIAEVLVEEREHKIQELMTYITGVPNNYFEKNTKQRMPYTYGSRHLEAI